MTEQKPFIIGLSGYARTGKDAVAGILYWEHDFDRDAFASALRTSLLRLDPIVATDAHENTGTRLSALVEELGWEGIKSSPHYDEVRRLQQRMGTEAGREVHGPDLWVNALFRRNWGQDRDVTRLAVSDVRFPNEADAIREAGGYVVRIERPGVGPANDHISEVGLDDYDFDARIINDGTLHDLSRRVAHMVETIRKGNR